MKKTDKRRIRNKESQLRIKRDITSKKSLQQTNRGSDQHLFFIERVRFESCV